MIPNLGSWDSSALDGSLAWRKNTLISNFHCLVGDLREKKRLWESTQKENLESESLRQFVVAMALVSDCNGPVVPLDPSAAWKGGRAACPPYNIAQTCIPPHHHSPTYQHPQPGENTPVSPAASTQQGEQQLPIINHRSIGVIARRQGLLPRVGGVS